MEYQAPLKHAVCQTCGQFYRYLYGDGVTCASCKLKGPRKPPKHGRTRSLDEDAGGLYEVAKYRDDA